MNHIKHLSGFFNKSIQDDRITTAHVSLYFALFQRWNLNRFRNPIIISRTEIMIASKIKSNATYHKCIKDLHQTGYIVYKPSFNPHEGTEVILPDLSNIFVDLKATLDNSITEKKDKSRGATKKLSNVSNKTGLGYKKPIVNTTCSNFDTPFSNLDTPSSNSEQEPKQTKRTGSIIEHQKKEATATLVNTIKSEAFISGTSAANKPSVSADELPTKNEKKGYISYNTINKLNNNLFNTTTIDNVGVKNETIKNQISKKQNFTPPDLEIVQHFFSINNGKVLEAEKFFNYYASNGWLVGGKTKMKDWKASARNWMLNTSKFAITNLNQIHAKEQPRAQNLHTLTDKDYAEPLKTEN